MSTLSITHHYTDYAIIYFICGAIFLPVMLNTDFIFGV